jgi:hypothetical protein
MSDEAPSSEPSRDDIADLEAFEARFPPGAFTVVAQALDLPEDLETLVWLRNLLVPEFRFFVESCPGEWFSRDERIARLEALRGAAVTLDRALGPGGVKFDLPRRFWGSDLITDRFIDTLRVLAREVNNQIQRLRASPGRRGRPRKDAARQLGKDLIRVYEKIMGKRAKDLNFGRFYRFAAAASRCLRDSVPEVDGEFHLSQSTLRESLREIWKSVANKQNEKPVLLKTQ